MTGKLAPLSERERRFVDAYMGAAAGNATKAARLAGYAKNTAEKQASRLLGKVGIQAAIDARTKEDPAVSDREERQRFYSVVMRNPKLAMKDRLKAAELQGKTQGDFIKRIKFEDVPAFKIIYE
jgi:phage terminase small subunit